MHKTRRRVLIAERRLPAYRVPFFEALRSRLDQRNIELCLAHGQAHPDERGQRDDGHLPWASEAPARYWGPLCWQPFRTKGMDLVIMGHENRLLFNHWLSLRPRRFRLACFGHGANFASRRPLGWRERFKGWSARRVDWWFAYTELSQHRLLEAGVPASRITVVNNTVDTAELGAAIAQLSASALDTFRARFDLSPGRTALFIGSLYPNKRLDLLLEAASICAARDPAFRLLVMGDGSQASVVLEATQRHRRWLHWLGAEHGLQRATAMAAADVLMLPAAVGLAIVDGFAAGLPLVTTQSPGHGPEIAYLQTGINGEIGPARADDYAESVMALLHDSARLRALRAAALQSAHDLSLTAMVEHFADGIEAALEGQP